MLKRYFTLFLLLIAIIEMYAQVREVVHLNGNYYSQATLMVDTIYNVSYTKDSVMIIVPRGEGIVYPNNEAMGQFITWMQGHPVYATPIVQYDSVAHRRNIAGDTLCIIFSNSTDALPQYEKEPIVWQHRQVTISDSAQLLSAEQYRAIAQGGDTSQFIVEPTIIYTDTLYVRNIVDTVYKTQYPYVDLGLSVKWATCNIGAESPEEYGDYFAWGEVEPKENYSWEEYKWSEGASTKAIKYNTMDGLTTLELEDDAAYVNLGGKWRMPSAEETNELIERCTWTWTTRNGVNGYEVVGPNGNSIFLPAGGYKGTGGPSYPAGEDGLYWLSEYNSENLTAAQTLLIRERKIPTKVNSGGTRKYGFMVRAVYDDILEPEYVDLGLSIKWATFNIGATAPEEYGDYFAWGETEPKAKYGWAQYKWGNGENKALTKYCNKAAYGEDGFTDNLTQLLPEDDAAHVNWGGNWRMPTAAEFDELIKNCAVEKSAMNGVNGYLLTRKINGNSIFLPMAGYYNFDLAPNKHQGNRTTCYYWSADMMYRSTVYTNINAYNLNSRLTEDDGLTIGNNTRRCGFSIRPVYDTPKAK